MMEEQDKRAEPLVTSRLEEHVTNIEETQVEVPPEQSIQATQQLQDLSPAQRSAVQANHAAQRERISALVAALGDPTHPLHQQAEDALIEIGDPAVSALNEALSPRYPWLTAYRAAEALGQIGNGRAAGPLLEALRHPNSNVRWSAVRALTVVGDARSLLELRRVIREDTGKTSWGESVAGAAQSALNQMQRQNMFFRSVDLIKTAVSCVAMLVALVFAWSVISALRVELSEPETIDLAAIVVPTPTPRPTEAVSQSQPVIEATAEPLVTPTMTPTLAISGTVIAAGNVRALPKTQADNVIGRVSEGDEIIFLTTTPNRQWYRVKLGERHATSSRIDSIDGTGWMSQSLLSRPQRNVDVEQIDLTEPEPSPEITATAGG